MKSISQVIKDNYYINTVKLKEDYYNSKNTNKTLNSLIESLNLPDEYLMKYTTKLEEASNELNNCKKCKSLYNCKNSYKGHIYYPEILNDNIVFDYIPCKYQKQEEERTKYKENIYIFELPLELAEASMKNIDLDDSDRFEIIKWLKNFLDTYEPKTGIKGLYLEGNFGCGKTYLVSACLNELAKKGHKISIVYYPEFLRSLKESFKDNEEYNQKFRQIKTSEVLLIDDIGAESTTEWSRDEVLGTILQYRMQERLTTFFTSNLKIEDLEKHFSITKDGIDKVKAKRIIERIKYLTEEKEMVSANKRK